MKMDEFGHPECRRLAMKERHPTVLNCQEMAGENIIRRPNGNPSFIDALIGPLPDDYRQLRPKLEQATLRAIALALDEDEDVPPDNPLANVSDGEL